MTDDWIDALVALVEAGARFIVVGAHALAVHGVPRATQDLDIWIDPEPDNAAKVWVALSSFGAPLSDLGIAIEDFSRAQTVVQVGLAPNRIDLMTEITGVRGFDAAWAARVERDVSGNQIPFLDRETLIMNKRATGRLKDRADIEALGEQP